MKRFSIYKQFVTDELNAFVYVLISHIPGKTGEIVRRYWLRGKFRRAGHFYLLPDVHIECAENFSIGDRSSINRGAWINAVGGIEIGNDVIIGPNVIITSANHRSNRTDITIREQGLMKKSVRIEDNVWIAANVTILPSVVVGTGSVIGAGAVVTKDIPPHSVAAGVPAKVVGKRMKG